MPPAGDDLHQQQAESGSGGSVRVGGRRSRLLECPFCSDARLRRARGVLQRRETVTARRRCEEDNTTRDDCVDQCHASGLFV